MGQTSNLGRVEPINWIRPKGNFFYYISLIRHIWSSTFVPETMFRRPIRLKQTDRTSWTIQTHSNWARRRTFHELNSLSLVRLIKSSTFDLGLTRAQSKLISSLLRNAHNGSSGWWEGERRRLKKRNRFLHNRYDHLIIVLIMIWKPGLPADYRFEMFFLLFGSLLTRLYWFLFSSPLISSPKPPWELHASSAYLHVSE